MILKLKIFLVGNAESKQLLNNIKTYLEKKCYEVTIYHPNDNFVLDSISLAQMIGYDTRSNVGFLFCNEGNNLSFITKTFSRIKNTIVTRENKLRESSYLNANVLTFSITKFSEEEILKIIIYYLNLFEQGDKLFY